MKMRYILPLLLTLLFSGCAKIPFSEQEPLQDAALVYLYVDYDNGTNDNSRNPAYKISIDGKPLEGYVGIYEYLYLNLKPQVVEITATRQSIEKQSITLDLEAGETYYLKVQSFSDDFAKFSIKEVPESVAMKTLPDTKLANEYAKEDEDVIEALIEPLHDKEQAEVVAPATTSKTDEIQKAYEMKEQGVLSQEEFEKLKAEILEQ
jgi:hypothetical protein